MFAASDNAIAESASHFAGRCAGERDSHSSIPTAAVASRHSGNSQDNQPKPNRSARLWVLT